MRPVTRCRLLILILGMACTHLFDKASLKMDIELTLTMFESLATVKEKLPGSRPLIGFLRAVSVFSSFGPFNVTRKVSIKPRKDTESNNGHGYKDNAREPRERGSIRPPSPSSTQNPLRSSR